MDANKPEDTPSVVNCKKKHATIYISYHPYPNSNFFRCNECNDAIQI